MSIFIVLRNTCTSLIHWVSLSPLCYIRDIFYSFVKYGVEEIYERARLFSVFGQDVFETSLGFLNYFDWYIFLCCLL
jgi:hypothetical protein